MKFEDFRKTCTVIDTSIPEPVTLPVVRHKMLERGPAKCRTCDYWPAQSYWLDTTGQYTTCRQDNHIPFISAAESAEIFASTYPELCSGCGGRFHNLKKDGICSSCRVSNQDQINRHLSRIPSDATKGQGSVAHWCYTCDRYGADSLNGKCVECARKAATPTDSFNLQKYLCVRCHEQKAYVLSGTCHECAVKLTAINKRTAMGQSIGELREKMVPKAPPIKSGPMLVKFTPTEDGDWDEIRIPINPRALSMNEKLGPDARMGVYEEC